MFLVPMLTVLTLDISSNEYILRTLSCEAENIHNLSAEGCNKKRGIGLTDRLLISCSPMICMKAAYFPAQQTS